VQAWLILICSILFNAAGNLLIRQFAGTAAGNGLRDYLSWSFAAGVVAFGIGVVLYGRALTQIPIVIAYPIQMGTCVLIIGIFAATVFGEKLGGGELLGIALVVAGIALLARVSG